MGSMHSIFLLLFLVVFVGLFIYAFIQLGKVLFHFNKAINNIADSNAPLNSGLLFSPSSYTPEGQAHLLKIKQHMRRFFYALLPVIVFIVIGGFFNDYIK